MNKAEHEAMHELGIKHHHHLDKTEIIDFFNEMAPHWDAEMIRNEAAIRSILDLGGIRPGIRVLDVACGTGVLFPDYMVRGVSSITGIDISSEMVRIAQEKFPVVDVICGDAGTYGFGCDFDAIMIYNAFPHFDDPHGLLHNLCDHLKPGGRLTVAHGMSRAALDKHHSGGALKVSVGLMSENDLAAMMEGHLHVDVKISDDEKYIVSGVKE